MRIKVQVQDIIILNAHACTSKAMIMTWGTCYLDVI